MDYAFGDSEIAAARLKVVAEVFAPSSAAFLRESVTTRPRLALDLGSGPGYSTHLVADTLRCRHTVGVDRSEQFLSLARRTANARVSFLRHELTAGPPAMEPCDLIYCRFLLTHIESPAGLVASWARQLAPGGLFLMDEVESIRTDHPAFAAYLGIVAAMLRDQSRELCVGPLLDGLGDDDSVRRRASGMRSLAVANRDAARMFLPNLRCWRERPFVRSKYSCETIDGLEADLRAAAEGPADRIEIEWGLRQLVLERI
jgi:trans-aconitate 2-methyltransferase